MISVSIHLFAVCLSDLHYLLPLMGLPVLLLTTLGFILPCEKLSHIVSPGDPAASGLLKINTTAFSSITLLVGLIISSQPVGTLCTPPGPLLGGVGITFCTYLAGVHGPLCTCLGGPSVQFSSVQFSCSVMSNSLRPHGLQHARPPCPSPTPLVYPISCPLSW